jgi:hypothetical protein
MTNQTNAQKCLGGSPAGMKLSRICALALAATLTMGGAIAGLAQSQTDATAPAPKPAKKTTAPGEKMLQKYTVHQSIELGGRVAKVSGSAPMWDTMVNQSSGMRVLSQSMELRSIDRSKTPLFDTLTTTSTGYGGDPLDVSRLNVSKGRFYDFAGTFRRDRNFFDYNQFANSLDPTPGEFIQQNNSLHLYDTVRRNSDGQLTLLPLSVVSIHLGFNHNTHEGPSLITSRGPTVPTGGTATAGTTAEVYQWFNNKVDTYRVGAEVKVAPRTTVSFDEMLVMFTGGTKFTLPNPSQPLYGFLSGEMHPVAAAGTATNSGIAASPTLLATTGFTLTSTTTATNCGNAAVTAGGMTVPSTSQAYLVNGVLSAYCKAVTVDSQSMPVSSMFPTEQLRLSSHYWENFVFNGRFSYSGGTTNVDGYNFTQVGYTATKPAYTAASGSTPASWNNDTVAVVQTGNGAIGGPANRFASNPRTNINADFGFVGEVTKQVSVSDNVSYQSFQTTGNTGFNSVSYTIPTNSSTLAGEPSLFTNLSSAGVVAQAPAIGTTLKSGTQAAGVPWWLNQRVLTNTVSASFIVSPQIKVSGGWRFKTRQLNYDTTTAYVPTTGMVWHENTGFAGAVLEPNRMVRVNVNYEAGSSKSASSTTMSNEFTREMPNETQHLKVRATLKPAKWVNFAASGNLYYGQNDDPLINSREHNQNVSGAASITPMEGLSFDLAYGYDEAYSVIDSCFEWGATTPADNKAVPFGATSTATCSASNSPATGGASFLYFNNYYKAPSGYYMGAVNYAPIKQVRFNGGVHMNSVHGSADILNPIQTPGSLVSRSLKPFADAEVKIAPQWAWHGNYTYTGYGEQGPLNAVVNGLTSNGLPSRNMHGNVLSLGVKYAF